jgi:hypothetical protein
MQFLNKSLDGLVSSMKKTELNTTKEFFKNYSKKITDDPSIIDASNLGFYDIEVPGETFEVAKEKKKKKKKNKVQENPLPSSSNDDGPSEPKRRRNDFILDEVDVEEEEGEEGKD